MKDAVEAVPGDHRKASGWMNIVVGVILTVGKAGSTSGEVYSTSLSERHGVSLNALRSSARMGKVRVRNAVERKHQGNQVESQSTVCADRSWSLDDCHLTSNQWTL